MYVGCPSPPWLFVILLNFPHVRSNWYSPSFCSTTFQNFHDISDLLSEVFKFQHHAKLCSKCSTFLDSTLHLCPICWWKEISLWMLLLLLQYWNLISRVNLASLAIMLTKQSKYNTSPSCFWCNVIFTVDDCLEILGTLTLTVWDIKSCVYTNVSNIICLFCTMTNKCIIISQIITLLHVSTLSCHP